jgi:tetratricopeptide (TPR) repeat protein
MEILMCIRKISEEIIRLARQKPELALEKANALVAERPDDAWTWSLRSYVFETRNEYKRALQDINRSIDIKPEEPAAHFEKANLFIELQMFEAAISSFSEAIEIGKKYQFFYYDQSSRLMRAFCYCKIGDFDSAASDLENVDDDMETWIDRMRSKDELQQACRNQRLD